MQTNNNINVDAYFNTIERFSFGGNVYYDSDTQDYFEPRLPGRFVTYSSSIGGRGWISSDYRKKFALDLSLGFRHFYEDPQDNLSLNVSPRYRFSDKFLLVVSSNYAQNEKEFGYIDNNGDDVFLGQRDRTSLENTISANFNFDPFKALNLRFRNFWSVADYTEDVFFKLNEDGTRSQIAYDTEDSENRDPNTNFNIWNIDLSYSWRFAPGSVATLLYRNQIFNQDDQSTVDYTESLNTLFDQPSLNQLSLRLVYFIDYNNLKNSFGNKA